MQPSFLSPCTHDPSIYPHRSCLLRRLSNSTTTPGFASGIEKSRPWLDRIRFSTLVTARFQLYFVTALQGNGGSLEILSCRCSRGLSRDFHGFVTDCYVFTRCSTFCWWIEIEESIFRRCVVRFLMKTIDVVVKDFDIKYPSVVFDWNRLFIE